MDPVLTETYPVSLRLRPTLETKLKEAAEHGLRVLIFQDEKGKFNIEVFRFPWKPDDINGSSNDVSFDKCVEDFVKGFNSDQFLDATK